MSKKNQIKKTNSSEEILKGLKKIDMSDYAQKRQEQLNQEIIQYKKDLVQYEADLEVEKHRIEMLGCPVCKTSVKEHITLHEQRTEPVIYGGRNAPLRTLAEYYVCQGCGTMYVDLHKKEIVAPFDPEQRNRFF